MGPQVQCKSYLPSYYSTRNSDKDTNNHWYYEGNMLSGHHYNVFLQKPLSGYSEFDKEILKQKILEHEATFRKQVHELHRLYRIQKDLMNELKMKELSKFPLPVDASQSNLFSPQGPSAVTEKACRIPCIIAGNTSFNRASASSTNEIEKSPPLNFMKEKCAQSSIVPSADGTSLRSGEFLDLKPTKFPRKMFDLQLPADIYIDDGDVGAEKENIDCSSFIMPDPLRTSDGIDHLNDLKLSLSFGDNTLCTRGHLRSYSQPQNAFSRNNLSDLITRGHEGRACSSVNLLSLGTQNEWTQEHHLLSGTSQLQKDIYTDLDKERTSSGFFSANKDNNKVELPHFHKELGQDRMDTKSFYLGIFDEKLRMLSKPLQPIYSRDPEVNLPCQIKPETQTTDKPTSVMGMSEKGYLDNLSHSGKVPQMPDLFSVAPPSGYLNTASSAVSSWTMPVKNISHIPIAVQALPCFIAPTTMNAHRKSPHIDIHKLSNACDKWQCNGDMRSDPKFGNKVLSFLDEFHHGSQPNSKSSIHLQLPSSNFPNANISMHVGKSPYRNSEDFESQESFNSLQSADLKPPSYINPNQLLPDVTQSCSTAQKDSERTQVDLFQGTSWLAKRTPCTGSDGMESCTAQRVSPFLLDYSQLTSRYDAMAPETRKRQDAGKGSSLLTLQYSASPLHVKESTMHRIVASDLLSDGSPGYPVIDKDQQSATCSPSTIDTICNERESSHYTGFSSDGNCPSSKNLFHVAILHTNGLMNQSNLNSMESSMDITISSEKLHEAVAEVPSLCFGTPVRVAADNLISLSSDLHNCSDDFSCPVNPASCDSLHLLAEVISSNAKSLKDSKEGANDDDGSDSFESMTLKLKEMKSEEYLSRRCIPEYEKDEKKGPGSSRRRQTRKRRQQRDFQKDVLPGLVSLSRHEVTEDLQAFAGLMRASGRSLKANIQKRNSRQKGFSCRGRGRRRHRSLTVSTPEARNKIMPAESSRTGLEIKGDMLGWGRTKRCRRQRIPLGNISALLT